MRNLVMFLSLVGAFSAFAERQPFERYQSILDRQMFGDPPPGFDPDKPPSEVEAQKKSKELTQEQEKLKSAIHFSAINIRADGKTEVGFTDSSDPKTPHHYFICAGETAGGWTVESADPETASMTIVKDGIQLELSLGDNSAKGGGNASKLQNASGNRSAAAAGVALSSRGQRALRQQQQDQMLETQRKEREAERAEAAKREAERDAERAAEREQQRQQLLAIQEELKRTREAREQEKAKEAAEKPTEETEGE